MTFSRSHCTQSRDRTGMEVNPLVFETSASTNSAIWASALLAFASAKVMQNCETRKFFGNNFRKYFCRYLL